MRKLWLLVLLISVMLISSEAARIRGQKRHAKRTRVRQRMKTTTEPPLPSKEEDPPEEKPEEWETPEKKEKEAGAEFDDEYYDLAKNFFKDFDDDNIREEPEENLIINEPEVVDFYAPFPHDERELKEKAMLYVKPSSGSKVVGVSEKVARGSKIQDLFNDGSSKINVKPYRETNTYTLEILGASWSVNVNLDTQGQIKMGDVEVTYFMGGESSKKAYLNNSRHGWDPECLKQLNMRNTKSEHVFQDTVLCTRTHGYLKERFKAASAGQFRSILCVETLTSMSDFGKIVCVTTPPCPSENRKMVNKMICSFDSVKYTTDKNEIDTIVDLYKVEALDSCGKHKEDVKLIIFGS